MANGSGRRGKVGRKKKRKAKYLSLSRHLTKAVDAPELESSPRSELAEEEHVQAREEGGGGREQDQQQQVEAFALHPEPSTLFAAAPSLTDILGASSSSGGGGGGGESSCGASPGDVSGGTGRFAGEEEDLARRALRGRERWVYCGSASSPSSATTTTTTTTSSSCSSAATTGASQGGVVARSPLLKLDYEEVLAAWAGRGSLYIGGGVDYVAAVAGHAPPKLELDSVFVEVGLSHHAAAWSAPVTTAGRAERVRRYKEKRQARLFSKRIRYEVRRLNAVRRPRLKGRFIKENEGAVAMAAGVGGELEPTP